MAKAQLASGLELEYDTFGSQQGEPLLLIMGLATQMIAWRDELCEMLAARGFYVVRFDNRDVGLSTYLDHLPVPGPLHIIRSSTVGKPGIEHYLLKDMADDAVGLLDHLGITKAHVWGVSMGGMIAQELSINYPGRVKSLALMMTSGGGRNIPKPKILLNIFKKPPDGDEARIRHQAQRLKMIGSVRSLEPSRDQLEERATQAHYRAALQPGTNRQMIAILNSPSRFSGLKGLELPVLIIHGEADPLVNLRHGLALKAVLPHARMEVFKDMGHDIPVPLYPSFAELLEELAESGA